MACSHLTSYAEPLLLPYALPYAAHLYVPGYRSVVPFSDRERAVRARVVISCVAQTAWIDTVSAIEPVGLDKVDAFLAHVIATGASSGTGGVPRFHPDPDAAIRPSYRATLLDQLSRRLDEPGWRRVWGVWHGGSLIAQAELRGGAVEAALHRATLGMTMLPTHHGQGLGRALLAHIIAWARTAGLAWIDLGVFVENAPARRLYARAGFVETGQLKDVFRIGGVSVDDVRMTLDLRGPGM